MQLPILERILDRHFKGRVWQTGPGPFVNAVPLAGQWVRPHPGQTVPTDADVEAWEADEIARDAEANDPGTIKTRAATAAVDIDATIKTIVFYLINHEKRLRALEGLAPITNAQAKNAIIAKYKDFLP